MYAEKECVARVFSVSLKLLFMLFSIEQSKFIDVTRVFIEFAMQH